jgi:hypothetical protein
MRKLWKTSRRYRVPLGLTLMAALFSLDARAQSVVYHSPNDNGVNPGIVFDLPLSVGEPLNLYLDAGALESQSGTACNDGDGREVCGYDIDIDALGSAYFTNFVPGPNVVSTVTPSKAKINGIFSLNPALGAVKIGQLSAASSDENGAVMMTGGTVVLAALQSESVSQMILAQVPEPLGSLPLIAGGVLLAGLSRRRRERSRSPNGAAQTR